MNKKGLGLEGILLGCPRTNNSGGCLPMLGLMVAHVWMILAHAELMPTSG